jgi:hypothetical protein
MFSPPGKVKKSDKKKKFLTVPLRKSHILTVLSYEPEKRRCLSRSTERHVISAV